MAGKRGAGRRFHIVNDGEILAEIGEDEHGERDAGFFGGEHGILHVALALLDLNLRLDDIDVRGFAAGFESAS